MLFSPAKSGLGGLLIVVAILYFTGAGSWLAQRLQNVGGNCYAVVSRVDAAAANTVCNAVSQVVAWTGAAIRTVEPWVSDIKQTITTWGSPNLEGYLDEFGRQAAGLAGSKQYLQQLMAAGPSALSADASLSELQRAMNSFTISQIYLSDGNHTQEAVNWLQTGASQPGGMGVMSQLTLGNGYANGSYGMPQNSVMAQMYLQQAMNSIHTLAASNSPQAQQMLSTLPASPDAMMAQIRYRIQDLQAAAGR